MLFLAALGLAVAWPRFRCGMDMADEGFLAYGAERVLQGQIPHRDFVSLQPPGSFYVAALVFKLLGVSLASLRIFGLFIYLTLIWLIYAIARLGAGPLLALAAAIPAMIFGLPYFDFTPFAVWQGIVASTAAVLCYLWAFKKRSRLLALLAGSLTGASVLLRQDQGLYTAIALLFYSALLRKAAIKSETSSGAGRIVLFCTLGVILVAFPTAAYWGIHGALPQMFQQLVVSPLTKYAKTSSLPFPIFIARSRLCDNAFIAMFYLAPAAIVLIGRWVGWRIWRHGMHLSEARLAFATVWSGLFFCQALTRSDGAHFLITLVPLFILCAWFWQMCGPSRPASVAVACAVAVLLVIATPSVLQTHMGVTYLDLDRGGVRVRSGADTTLVIRQIRDTVPANRSILCLPYAPMLYFLCERRNPTRWNYLWPGDQTVEDHKEFVREAMDDPPGCVLLLGRDNLNDYAPIIHNYIEANFKQTSKFGDLSVYMPN